MSFFLLRSAFVHSRNAPSVPLKWFFVMAAGLLPATGALAQTAVGSTSGTLSATVTITTAGTLGQINVLTQGAANKDFQYVSGGTCTTANVYAVNNTCTVMYTFTPSRPGQRLGAISLTTGSSSSATVLGTTFIAGTGTGPLAVFPGSNTISQPGSTNGFFSLPRSLAVDGNGDVFVADTNHSAVKEIVAVNGVVTSGSTVNTVGSGFYYPNDVAVDGSGDVFVADTNNSAVKEIVAVNGVVTSGSTVNTVGSGFSSPRGVAVDGSGDVFVADTSHSAVKEIVAVNGVVTSGSTVNTVGSGFSLAFGVAVDGSGHVFVADYAHNAAKEIDLTTAPALAFASTAVGATSSDSPQSVSFQNGGNASLSIASVGASTASFTGSLGNCPGTLSAGSICTPSFSFTPQAVGSPLSANGVVTDSTLNVTGSTQTVALSGTATADAFSVTGVSPSHGPPAGGTTVTITGTGLSGVTQVKFGGVAATSYTLGTATQMTAVAPAGTVNTTVDIIVGSTTDVSIASTADQFTYTQLATLTVTGYPTSQPSGVAANVTVTAYDSNNNVLTGFTGTVTLTSSDPSATLPAAYTFTTGDAGVHVFPVTLKTAGTQSITAASSGISGSETGIVSTGYVAVVSYSSARLSKFMENGTPYNSSGYTGGGIPQYGAAVDAAGDVFSLNQSSNLLVEFNSAGTPLSGSGYTGGGLNNPQQPAVDGAGQVWVVNGGNNSISVFNNGGTAVTPSTGYTSGGVFNAPTSLSIDISGNVWVANSGNNAVVEVLGAAAPTAPPSTALTNGTTGARP
jgi:hypothetical protein